MIERLKNQLIQRQVEIIGEDEYVYIPSQQTINRLHGRFWDRVDAAVDLGLDISNVLTRREISYHDSLGDRSLVIQSGKR